MRSKFVVISSLSVLLALGLPGWGQSDAGHDSATASNSTQKNKKASGPGKEIGKGGEDIGKGAAKGSADLAKGAEIGRTHV